MTRAILLTIAVLLASCGGGIDTRDDVSYDKVEAAKCCPPDVQCVCPVYPG